MGNYKFLKTLNRVVLKHREDVIVTNKRYIPTNLDHQIFSINPTLLIREVLDGIVEEVDSDQSGTVDFDEFFTMMTG